MFDFSFSEMMLAGVVALVVLGPQRLPKVARKAGEWLGKAQRLAAGFKDELSRQADLAELKNAADKVKSDLRDIGGGVEESLRPAWDNLPELRTPADFGVDEYGAPLTQHDSDDYAAFGKGSSRHFNVKSLHKQALARKRGLRPRYRPTPRLRNRK